MSLYGNARRGGFCLQSRGCCEKAPRSQRATFAASAESTPAPISHTPESPKGSRDGRHFAARNEEGGISLCEVAPRESFSDPTRAVIPGTVRPRPNGGAHANHLVI
ncbi:hypothetical protein GCM10010518_59170 [Kitasatospora cinereorecta]